MSQLGRVARRALPLVQQLERSAPGVVQHFSSEAGDAAGQAPDRGAAAGRGAGPRAPEGGPRGPGARGRGAGQGPRRDGGEGGRGPRRAAGGEGGRQPGAMSELLAGEGQPQRPARPPMQRRGPPQRSRFGGGGGWGAARSAAEGEAGLSPAMRHLPRELDDRPFDILMKNEYALKDPAAPDAPAVPVREAAEDVADVANLGNLRLAKYFVSQAEWRQFSEGRMDDDEANNLADRMAAAFIADERYWQKQEAWRAAIDADPDYDLAASVGSQPALRGSPRPPAPSEAQLAAELDAQKPALMAQYALSEEDYEEVKAATVRQQRAAALAAAAPVLPDHLARAQRLGQLLEQALPADHPHFAAAKKRLEVLQSNPGWSHERKMVFAKRLIKRLASLPA